MANPEGIVPFTWSSLGTEEAPKKYVKLHGTGFKVPAPLFKAMFPYQREGVKWMFSLTQHAPKGLKPERPEVSHGALRELASSAGIESIDGGILGDDMGLGKTLQSVAFVASMFHSDMVNAVLVACPVSLLPTWEKEFQKWAPEIRVKVYSGTKNQRAKAMRAVQEKGGVLLTSVNLISTDPVTFGGQRVGVDEDDEEGGAGDDNDDDNDDIAVEGDSSDGEGNGGGAGKKRANASKAKTPAKSAQKKRANATTTPSALLSDLDIAWDLLIVDEAHKGLKNSATRMARAMRTVKVVGSIVLLTGTPIQNRLDELWSLMDQATRGGLLGTKRVFKREIADHITLGRDRLATADERQNAADAEKLLTGLIAPYFLRREKSVVLKPGQELSTAASSGASSSSSSSSGSALSMISKKREVVVWTRMAPLQLCLYSAFLKSPEVKAVLNTSESPLAAITMLKKIACHPFLVKDLLPAAASNRGIVRALEGMLDAAMATTSTSTSTDRKKAKSQLHEDAVSPEMAAAAKRQLEELRAACTLDLEEDPGYRFRYGSYLEQQAREEEKARRKRAGAATAAGESVELESDDDDDEGGLGEAEDGEAAAAAVQNGNLVSVSSLNGPDLRRILREEPWRLSAFLETSGKMQAFMGIVRLWLKEEGNPKALVFSSSLKTLDLLQGLLSNFPAIDGSDGDNRDSDGEGATLRIPTLRIDGSISDPNERRAIVDRFNADPEVRVCLLSTGVGALGLTMTSATRVLLFEPTWNPSVEQQAVDRAYRIGQTRDVVTYRLITAGSIEEKMYRLQVFKAGLTQSVLAATTEARAAMMAGKASDSLSLAAPSVQDGDLTKFLTKADLKDLFMLGPTTYSETKRMVDQVLLLDKDRGEVGVEGKGMDKDRDGPEVALHLRGLDQLAPQQGSSSASSSSAASPPAVLLGVSPHDRLFSLDAAAAKRLKDLHAAAKALAGHAGGSLPKSLAGVDPHLLIDKHGKPSVYSRLLTAADHTAGAADDDDDGEEEQVDEDEEHDGDNDEMIDLTSQATPTAKAKGKTKAEEVIEISSPAEADAPAAFTPEADFAADAEASNDVGDAENDHVLDLTRAMGRVSLDVGGKTEEPSPSPSVGSQTFFSPTSVVGPRSGDSSGTATSKGPSAPASAIPAAGAAVCERHVALCRRARMPLKALSRLSHCICLLSPESREVADYAQDTLQQVSLVKADGSPHDPELLAQDLDMALDALLICDADPFTHIQAMRLGKALGWLPGASSAIDSNQN